LQRKGLDKVITIALFSFSAFLLATNRGAAQTDTILAEHIHRLLQRPEFRHANFGIEFYSLDTQKPVFELNSEKLFTPASTTKLLTEGTALHLLGPDYRFHTRVYRTGPITAQGTLKGDVVLVASGDPNISGRIRSDGTLAFENEDHAYGGSPDTRAVPGDTLLVIRELAHQIAAQGIKRIQGRVLIDVSLFPEGERELGTGIVISPIAVNDNIVDVTAAPGATVGAPVQLAISPETPYVKFANHAKTGLPDSEPDIEWTNDRTNPDGSHSVTVTGNMPLGKPSILYPYAVAEPSRFAAMALVEALNQDAVKVEFALPVRAANIKGLSRFYEPTHLIAEHVSPPFSQEIKVTLKVSQNLHASMMPFFLGAVIAQKTQKIDQGAFDLEHDFLEGAGLDLSSASQSDGAGGARAAFFTPDFMVHYLAYMASQKDFPVFYQALPILGRDGTLWNIQVGSPASGHVHAKTGTLTFYDALNRNVMVVGKGLAGYLTTPDGQHLAFALYANHISVPTRDDLVTKIVGQALGEIAVDGYLYCPRLSASTKDLRIQSNEARYARRDSCLLLSPAKTLNSSRSVLKEKSGQRDRLRPVSSPSLR
jgi:PBP4 family serine-type D-alanyl-D-alanine carboxypeptidase